MRKLPFLGELNQHATIPEWWVSGPTRVPFLLEERIPFTVMVQANRDVYPRDVAEAVERFLTLGPADRAAAAARAFEYYRLYVNAVPEVDLGIDRPEDIWSHIRIRYAAIQRKGPTGRNVYVLLVCDCRWDDEHGLQFVYQGGHKLILVGEQDGGVTYAEDQDADASADSRT